MEVSLGLFLYLFRNDSQRPRISTWFGLLRGNFTSSSLGFKCLILGCKYENLFFETEIPLAYLFCHAFFLLKAELLSVCF